MIPQTQLDMRQLALVIAKAHDLSIETIDAAHSVSEDDDEFMTAICASADLEGIVHAVT